MTQTTGTPHELPKHSISQRVSSPSFRVSALDLFRFLPALLLHTVRKTPWIIIRVGRDAEFLEEIEVVFG